MKLSNKIRLRTIYRPLDYRKWGIQKRCFFFWFDLNELKINDMEIYDGRKRETEGEVLTIIKNIFIEIKERKRLLGTSKTGHSVSSESDVINNYPEYHL